VSAQIDRARKTLVLRAFLFFPYQIIAKKVITTLLQPAEEIMAR